MAMRGRFSVDRIQNEDEAFEEMDFQYGKLQTVESTEARKNRFYHMLDIYDRFPAVREVWTYIETAVRYTAKFVKKIVNKVSEIINSVLHQHDYFYIMRFYDQNNNHVFDKVGSSVDVSRRLKQHLDKYCGVHSGEILYKIDTENVAASSLENCVRNYLIRTLGEEKYIPKDRFRCKIDLDDLLPKIPACLNALRKAEIV